jgi:hypothetical protein
MTGYDYVQRLGVGRLATEGGKESRISKLGANGQPGPLGS